jgi:hypothetical protein
MNSTPATGYHNAHPVPDETRLSRILDQTLDGMIAIHRSAAAPPARIALAGIPDLVVLETERQRRDSRRLQVAS